VSDTTELYTAQVIYIQNKLIKLLTLIEQERLGEATFVVDGLIQYVDSFIGGRMSISIVQKRVRASKRRIKRKRAVRDIKRAWKKLLK